MKHRYQIGEAVYEVQLERTGTAAGAGYRVAVNGPGGHAASYDLEVLDSQPGSLTLRFGPAPDPSTARDPAGRPSAQEAIKPQVVYWGAEGDVKWLSSGGCTYRLERPRERARGRGRSAAGPAPEDILRAPMPAQVRAVQVAEGDAVEAGQTLLLLEAMKMEIKLASPRAATVCRVMARQGETVERDQVLVELE